MTAEKKCEIFRVLITNCKFDTYMIFTCETAVQWGGIDIVRLILTM